MHAKSEQGGSVLGNRTPLQAFLLARLRHLQEQSARFNDLLATDDWRRKLIARALYSAYQDCLAHELVDEAKAIVAVEQSPERN